MISTKLASLFPLSSHRTVSMFYILSSVTNAWFMAGVWVFIWGKFMNNQQIGISDAITFTVGFLLELPSGAIADNIGRKRAIIFGHILLVFGSLLVGLSSSFIAITGWYLLWTIGYTFQSGSTEALVYDYLKSVKKEDQWSKVIGTANIIGRISTLIAITLGGFLFSIWFRLPYLAAAAYGIIGIIAAIFLYEKQLKHTVEKFSWRQVIQQTAEGVSVLKRPHILPFSLTALTVAGILYVMNWGLLRPLTAIRFGYTPETAPLLQSTASLSTIIAIILLIKLRSRFQIEKLLLLCGIIFSLFFSSLFLPFNWIVGGFVLIIISISASYVDQLFSIYINHHTQSHHRATTLSAISLFTRAPYVALALLTGYLADKNQLAIFCLVLGSIAVLITLYSYYKYRYIKQS